MRDSLRQNSYKKYKVMRDLYKSIRNLRDVYNGVGMNAEDEGFINFVDKLNIFNKSFDEIEEILPPVSDLEIESRLDTDNPKSIRFFGFNDLQTILPPKISTTESAIKFVREYILYDEQNMI